MKLDQDYKEEYDDINSNESLTFIADLDSKLQPFFKKKFPDLIKIIYKRFFKGSVGVDYELLFPTTSTVTDGNIVQALREGNGTNDLGLTLTGDITVTKQVVQTTAAPTTAAPTTAAPTTAAPTATKGNLQRLFIFYVAFVLLPFNEVQGNLTRIKVSTTLSV